MSNRGFSRAQIFLIELIFMILFFAISASILLQVFFKAREYALDASVLSAAVIAAESTAEEKLSLSANALASSAQEYYYDQHWNATTKAAATYEVQVDWTETPRPGSLTELTVTVYSVGSQDPVYTLETKKYNPMEQGGAA